MFDWTYFNGLLDDSFVTFTNDGNLVAAQSAEVPGAGEYRQGFYAEFFDISADKSIQSLSQVNFSAAPVHAELIQRVMYQQNENTWWEDGRGNFFAARFTGGLMVETAGTYTFRLETDSGVQLRLGDQVIMGHDGADGLGRGVVTVELQAGLVPLELLYFETRGDQLLKLRWSGPDTGGNMVRLQDLVVPLGDRPVTEAQPEPTPEPDPSDGDQQASGPDVPVVDVPEDAVAGFAVTYFDISDHKETRSLAEIDFTANPAYRDVVGVLDYSGDAAWWDGGRGNFFAVQAEAGLVVETAGTYTFRLTSDSVAQLKLGDTVLIENSSFNGAVEKTVTVALDAGVLALEVLYFETRGEQTLHLQWSGPDTGNSMVDLTDVLVLDQDAILEPAPEPDPEPAPEPDPEPAPEPDPEPVPEPDPDSGQDSGEAPIDPVVPRPEANGPGAGADRVEAQSFTPGTTVTVAGGRVTTLELNTSKTIQSMEITSGPAAGHVTVNPDNSLALVLSGSEYKGNLSFGYAVTYADGSTGSGTAALKVLAPKQGAGWGAGEHYMLETDNAGNVVVETGDNHRKVYISGSNDALSLRDIAAREGISKDSIDGRWFLDHPQYGASENMALDSEAGMMAWYELTIGKEAVPGSHWLLFESGYSYSDLGKVVGEGASGESALHPLHVTSWGSGPRPVLDEDIAISQKPSEHVVVSNLKITEGLNVKGSSNILITDVDLVDRGMGFRNVERVTLHDSTISYATVDTTDGSGVSQGLIVVASDSVLLDGNVFHHNGWLDGYNPDGTNHAPDGFSHNVYLQWNTTDVTYRDNISSQSSSVGAQLRGGAFAEGNLFVDNNVAGNFLGGNYKDFGPVGNFTYFADNVVTSGSYKDAQAIGAKGWGLDNGGYETTMVDNIVAHLANPDDPSDLQDKQITRHAVASGDDTPLFYDDTKVLNWLGADPYRWKDNAVDRNLEDVDVSQAMQTTIQRYAAQLTNGQEATIDGLMDYIISLSETAFDDAVSAREIIDYFRDGFGMDIRGTAQDTHRFVPNDIADGMRWDNRSNWDSGELPSDGDRVDLGGNWVNYGTLTTRDLKALDLGEGGKLGVTSGLLEVDVALRTGGGDGYVAVENAGQFWTAGVAAAGRLEAEVSGGRFANTGTVQGETDIRLSDNAQAILATDNARMVLHDDSTLRIEGSEVKVGFDGDSNGPAILQMADKASLGFVADAQGFSTIGEFRSGAWDQQGSPVRSGVSLDGRLEIDLSDYRGGTGTLELIQVDALQGMFDRIDIRGLADGLKARTVIDFDADRVSLEITRSGGASDVRIIGSPNDGSGEASSLWQALTAGEGAFDAGTPQVVELASPLPDDDFLF